MAVRLAAKFDQPYTSRSILSVRNCSSPIWNFRVREIDLKSGTVRTVAGNGKKGMPKDGEPATSQPLVSPRAACYGPNGMFTSHRETETRFAKSMQWATFTRSFLNPAKRVIPAMAALPRMPWSTDQSISASMDAGNLIITDDVNHCIRLYSPKTGKIHLVAGVPKSRKTNQQQSPQNPTEPAPRCANRRTRTTLIADSMNHRVLRFEKIPSID